MQEKVSVQAEKDGAKIWWGKQGLNDGPVVESELNQVQNNHVTFSTLFNVMMIIMMILFKIKIHYYNVDDCCCCTGLLWVNDTINCFNQGIFMSHIGISN